MKKSHFFEIGNSKNWFLVALVIKSLMLLYFSIIHNWVQAPEDIINFFFVRTNDFMDYILPIESLIDSGEYKKIWIDGSVSYAYRMPGLLPLYGPMYALLGRDIALTVMVFLNLIMDALTVVMTASIAKRIFRRERVFYWAFFLYALFGLVSFHNNYMLTETSSTFGLIAAIYFLIKAIDGQSNSKLVWSGLFLVWSIFLRPALGPLLLGFPVIYLVMTFQSKKLSMGGFIKHMSLFAMPVIFVFSIWIARNYVAMDRLVPLATSTEEFGTDQSRALFKLVIAWGGDIQSWIPESEASWFAPPQSPNYNEAFSNSNPFQNWVFTKDYNLDSLRSMREDYWLTFDTHLSNREYEIAVAKFVAKAKGARASFIKERPFQYYVQCRLILLKDFLLLKHVYNSPFLRSSLFFQLNKAFFLLLYYLCVIPGLIGILIVLIRRQLLPIAIAIIFIIHVMIHAPILGFIENRYLCAVFPVITIFSAFVIDIVFSKLFQRKAV